MTMFTIIILAMISVFVGLRLYSVLGDRSGHEQKPMHRSPHRAEEASAPSPPLRLPDAPDNSASDQRAPSHGGLIYDEAIATDIRRLMIADRSFNANRFLEGAQAAYRMILEAFWSGDHDKLRELTDDALYAGFAEAIATREANGETLDNRLVRIEETQIIAADLADGVARVTVRFVADIVAITRNSKGEVVAGSLDDAIITCDQWTFARAVSSDDPNWRLDQTEVGEIVSESDNGADSEQAADQAKG